MPPETAAKPAPRLAAPPAAVPPPPAFVAKPVYVGPLDPQAISSAGAVEDTTPRARDAGWSGNMAKNPGFEEDFVNTNGEGHVLSFKGDWYYNQKDDVPDYWDFTDAKRNRLASSYQTGKPDVRLDRAAPTGPLLASGVGRDIGGGQARYWTWKQEQPHAGLHSLQLEQGVCVEQQFHRAVSQWGGGAWGGVENRAMPVSPAEMARFNLPWRATVWVRGGGSLTLIGLNEKEKHATATAPAGNQWQKIEVVLSPDKLPAPGASVSVVLTGPGEFDDLVVQEQLPDSPNLARNASFESDKENYPVGWSAQKKFRAIGPTYYTWTDWNHAFSENRGAVTVDRLVAHDGRQSVRFDMHPGDEKFIESDAIALNQKEPRVVEVGVFVRADRALLLDVRAVDENGYWMASYSPRQPEYYKAGQSEGFLFGNGTFGWRYVRKFFVSATGQPLKAMRVRLCARGFNGDTLDDAGTRAYDMTAGTVWWDDLHVYERTSTADELKSRGVSWETGTPAPGKLADADLDLGQRFVGENVLAFSFTNNDRGAKYQLRLTTTIPGGEARTTESPALDLRKGQRGRLAAPYVVDRIASELKNQATLAVELLCDGKPLASEKYVFNTWPVVADIDVSRHYNLPNENPVTTSINLGVADATLNRVAKIELQLVTPADGKVQSTTTIDNLRAAFEQTRAGLPGAADANKYHHNHNPIPTGPEFGLPTPEWTVDRTNLLITRLDLSKLKVWPQNYPVRDTVLVVRGLDKSGRELFSQTSEPFCRMEAPPKQEAIQKVEVRDDGAVLINGKPRYLFGASHQDFRLLHSPERIAQLGLMGHRLPQGEDGSFAGLHALWEKWGLYGLQVKPVSGMTGVTVVQDMNPDQRAALEKFVKEGGMQNIVSINTGGWEAVIGLDNPAVVEKHKQLNDWVRRTTGRPVAISTSGAYNAWWLPNYPFYDINFAETEMWGPMDFNVIYAPYMKRAGAKPAWVYLPQLYDNTPYERYRFETYENIIRGSAGVSMIQGIGDPTFNRGLAGELRYLEAPLNSTDLRTDVTAEPMVSHKATRYDGKTYVLATNAGPIQIGKWDWHEGNAQSGRAAHDGDTVNTQWFRPAGIRIHGFRGLAMPELIQKGDKIVQYVWIDPKEKPDWAMVCVRGDGRFAHNAVLGAFDWEKFKKDEGNIIMYSELNHSVWHEINWRIDDQIYERAVVLLGKKEADKLRKLDKIGREKVEQIAYKPEHFHNAGKLPEGGSWYRIEMDAEKFGLVGKLVDGFAFLTQNGRAMWDYSALERNGQVVRVFSEDTVGVDRNLLHAVRINVPGLKAGTRVRVLFENREVVAEEGGFIDDFTGTDTYGSEGGAVVGDMFGFIIDPDRELVRMMPSGYGYTYGPTAVHIYEIAK
ncbi:MAG: hypothetical protein K8S99_11815 [Planctomycetes bacterium]|nr:hypothetical protein [Planctomycetota bacterium]